jgi:hypothetical protein
MILAMRREYNKGMCMEDIMMSTAAAGRFWNE